MNLTDIETFLTLVETRNITKTAESLFVTQPTVSRRLQNLEEEVGIELIRRKKGMKQIELTEKGEAFVLVAERWISVWQEMNLIRQEESSTLLTVSSVDTFNTAVLANIYRDVLANPDNKLKLHVQTHHSATIYRLIEQRQVDIGFVLFNLNYKNVNVRPIAREKMYIVQRDCNTALHSLHLHTDELADRTEIHFRGNINFENWHSQWINYGGISPVYVDTYALLRRLLSLEKTWTIVPASVAEQLQQDLPIIVSHVSNDIAPPERIAYCITHKNMSDYLKQAAKQFESAVAAYVREKGWN
ncbi:MAG: LysR family transcriptional regulator [Oscillospiraceae bacterium]|nr:LysR family transcriptional regulator [Oscillospiraceae bacterium]